jgi:hypothetical protein
MTTKDAKHEDQGIRIVGQDHQEITEVRQWNRLLRHLLQPIDLHDPVRDPVQVEIAADDGLLCVWAAEGEVLTQFPHDAPNVARQYLLSNQSNCQLWLRSRNVRGAIVHTYALQVERLRHGERNHNLARETTLDAVVAALRRCTPIHEEDVERAAEVVWESIDPIVTRSYDEAPRQTMAEIQRDLRVQNEGIRHRAAQFATTAARAESHAYDRSGLAPATCALLTEHRQVLERFIEHKGQTLAERGTIFALLRKALHVLDCGGKIDNAWREKIERWISGDALSPHGRIFGDVLSPQGRAARALLIAIDARSAAIARDEPLGLDEVIAKMQTRYDTAVKREPNANTFEAHMGRSLRIDEGVGRENGPTVPRAYNRSRLSPAAVTAAARNIGLDLTCGACASVYFTGIRDAGEHATACITIPALRARIDVGTTAPDDHPRPERHTRRTE